MSSIFKSMINSINGPSGKGHSIGSAASSSNRSLHSATVDCGGGGGGGVSVDDDEQARRQFAEIERLSASGVFAAGNGNKAPNNIGKKSRKKLSAIMSKLQSSMSSTTAKDQHQRLPKLRPSDEQHVTGSGFSSKHNSSSINNNVTSVNGLLTSRNCSNRDQTITKNGGPNGEPCGGSTSSSGISNSNNQLDQESDNMSEFLDAEGDSRQLSLDLAEYEDGDGEDEEEAEESKESFLLPEEECDIPTFLHTKNCDPYLIERTRQLLKERYAKNPDSFYDTDYKRMLTDDWTVSRFLLRRRLDPKRTAKLMEECGRFRKQYKMSEVQLWEFPVEFHKAGGLFMYAPDRVGNLTVYLRVRMYRRVPEISDVFKAFILCVLEQADVANNGRGTAAIFDLTGCGLQNVDLSFLSWLLSSFRNYCPKGVSYILVYNLPWILNATCKLAMSWMSASNRRALRFVHGNEIEQFIARENLPDYCGGTCKINYRSVPDGSLPATEVCDRLDMTREQALKIRELFKEYLDEEDLKEDDSDDDDDDDRRATTKKP